MCKTISYNVRGIFEVCLMQTWVVTKDASQICRDIAVGEGTSHSLRFPKLQTVTSPLPDVIEFNF